MHLAEETWMSSYECFFEAFKCYDEAGSPRRINCLKMLVISNMLSKSDIDPFGAQGTVLLQADTDSAYTHKCYALCLRVSCCLLPMWDELCHPLHHPCLYSLVSSRL